MDLQKKKNESFTYGHSAFLPTEVTTTGGPEALRPLGPQTERTG